MSFLNPISILSILIALSVHEWAHAFAADKLGDPTARQEGRLTLNPIAHLDPLGALLFLTVGFGWGRPVPVDPRYFHRPKRDMAIVAVAGPFSNLILAALSFGVLRLFDIASVHSAWELMGVTGVGAGSAAMMLVVQFLASSLFVNLSLMAFNLLPVAPLDGSKIIGIFVPYEHEDLYQEYLKYGPYILLFLLVGERLLGVTFLADWITWIMDALLGVFAAVMGAL